MTDDVTLLQAELSVTRHSLACANRARDSLYALVNDMHVYQGRLEQVAVAAKALVKALKELEESG